MHFKGWDGKLSYKIIDRGNEGAREMGMCGRMFDGLRDIQSTRSDQQDLLEQPRQAVSGILLSHGYPEPHQRLPTLSVPQGR